MSPSPITSPITAPKANPTASALGSTTGSTTIAFFWTQGDALDARDEAFDAGAHTVHVSGLPMIGAAVGFPEHHGPLPDIKEV